MLPSGERASFVLFGSLKYSNGVAVLNQTVPGVPTAQGCIASSRMCNSPSRTLPTVPRWGFHSALLQAVKPRPSVAPEYAWMIGPHHLIISSFTRDGQGAAAWI